MQNISKTIQFGNVRFGAKRGHNLIAVYLIAVYHIAVYRTDGIPTPLERGPAIAEPKGWAAPCIVAAPISISDKDIHIATPQDLQIVETAEWP